ncbi:MAG: hypothetical protein ACKO0Z_14780, partial [Betaproteobacteria bacterium]
DSNKITAPADIEAAALTNTTLSPNFYDIELAYMRAMYQCGVDQSMVFQEGMQYITDGGSAWYTGQWLTDDANQKHLAINTALADTYALSPIAGESWGDIRAEYWPANTYNAANGVSYNATAKNATWTYNAGSYTQNRNLQGRFGFLVLCPADGVYTLTPYAGNSGATAVTLTVYLDGASIGTVACNTGAAVSTTTVGLVSAPITGVFLSKGKHSIVLETPLGNTASIGVSGIKIT